VTAAKITQSEAVELFEVSGSKIKKDRKVGLLPGEQDDTGRMTWRYAIEDLEKLYRRRELDLDSDQGPDLDADLGAARSSSMLNLGSVGDVDIETQIRLEYTERDLEQRTKERDRARSDHEHERNERERLERETVQLRAELDAARTIASDRADSIAELKAKYAEQVEKTDEYARNLTRRYRRAVRRAEKAATATDSGDE